MKYKKEISLLLFFLLSVIGSTQELPPIVQYLPDEYGGETQNWSISQSDDKYIYVANNNGLLEYNGANWELYPSPNGTIIRSVNVVEDRIYTGCYMNFGFWKKNAAGLLEYTSLSNPIKERLIEDEQFWDIVSLENRVLFQSLNRIYIYNSSTEEIDVIESEVAIVSMHNVNGVVYYQDFSNGIFRIEKGEPKLVLPLSLYNIKSKIVTISEIPNGILLLTNNQGFFKFSEGKIQKWSVEADELLEQITIYSSKQLKDKSFVLGTISTGLIYLSPEGKVRYQINQSNGLSNNTVLSLFEDSEENIWLALDDGINCINMKSPITIFSDERYNIGAVYASKVFGDFLYVGTNQGLFYKRFDDKNADFTFIEGTKGQVWSIFAYDNTLFCGHNSGAFLIEEGRSVALSNLTGVWNFKKIPEHPDWLLLGTYTGLMLLQKENGQWVFKHRISGFDYSARFMEIYENEIWINHGYKGLFRLNVDKAFSEVTKVSKDTSMSKENSSIIKFKDKILYTCTNGAFYFDKSTNESFKKDNDLSSFFGNEDYITGKLIEDDTGKLWGFSQENISYVSQSQFSDYLKVTRIPIPSSLRKGKIGYENIIHIKDNEYLLGTTNGYMILDLSKVNLGDHTIILDKVSVKSKGANFEEVSFSANTPVFEPSMNTISFNYTIPEYDKYLISQYQYKLEGFYDDWSSWTTRTDIVFENLPFGEYTFMVRTKTGNRLNENIASYTFVIDRPWYLSKVAIIIYITSLLIVLFLIHKAYKGYYTKQKSKLVEENKKQLELKQLESEKEIMKLSNEKLKHDIESKNRELASSTMNIIKKNEILSTIKKELQKITSADKAALQNVERIIDRNLNNKDDWKHFEEAFNNVDKDFLKKLKSIHPDLTPHDLRFCTYLRLNLSSKEIAPLLNISVRSVEIKRYRLRKKLKLEHSDSLVNYILEI
ncbi:triple tyrosine motif-containing protein [Aquimarina pacifica]|uniref:triple tyrosine motif-containing protein n=1 Tax=Aquimarina pacifica TaxID=1296415 RepID=UPI0006871971|nr:triple tyrosine motif-containing protein [Aquimarina pacifica]